MFEGDIWGTIVQIDIDKAGWEKHFRSLTFDIFFVKLSQLRECTCNSTMLFVCLNMKMNHGKMVRRQHYAS